jgi:hypothetical protein
LLHISSQFRGKGTNRRADSQTDFYLSDIKSQN